MKHFIKTLSVVLLSLLITSCYNDNKEELYENHNTAGCDTSDTKFSSTIQEIFVANCALSGCHSATSQQSGLNLSSYADIAAIANDGRLEARITSNDMSFVMPPNNRLPQCEIDKILKWTSNGAQNN